ncbi:peptidyl-prolyl cis-trans isomerase-like 4 [Amphiura filiformis]|uniref:peptidyl-prolyl cis-trans isomerase-like 4 n=1 Tax=Amphiura filiformis TaxID=82378 RepID=UPI003B224E97
MAVLLETTLGDIVVDLYPEERPRCCLNFLKLCKIKYYNYCLFHSIQTDFMAQTGDPTGTGKGGASIFSKLYGDQAKYFEMETSPRIKHTKKGAVSMVNNGSECHGSQFFFTLAENLDYLDGQHTVFGEVSEGMEILMKINEAICDKENRPYQDIRINHTVILDDPYDDPKGLEIPDRSPEPSKEQLESGRIGADEEIDDTKGMAAEEVEERFKEKEAKAKAQILEMIGDLPDADVKPPENVLFVCKLNPVTTSEDLEIIFSRFGKINSCEVIKDKVTDDSLQYAFIEFEREEDCEEAYFKMDNVLIDERRIHVDFSQSVAKVNKQGKVVWEHQKPDGRPQYKIKDQTSRQSKKYDLVLDDDVPSSSKSASRSRHRHGDSEERVSSKKPKRRKSSESESSDSEQERRRKDQKKKKKRRDSSSEDEDRNRRKDSSREDRDRRDRHRGQEDRRERSYRDEDRYRGKDRERDSRGDSRKDKYRDRDGDRYGGRSRDRYRDERDRR